MRSSTTKPRPNIPPGGKEAGFPCACVLLTHSSPGVRYGGPNPRLGGGGVRRFRWMATLVCLAAVVVVPQAAAAADRMYVGFQDDPSFRFRDTRDANLDQAEAANATVIR